MAGSSSKTPRFFKTKSIDSVSAKAKRSLFTSPEPDIEDYGHFFASKKKKVADTLLEKYRNKRGLFVTDVSKTEWCQKQMEFSLFFDDEECNNNNSDDKECFSFVYEGTGKNNNHYQAMKAGIDRHVELRNEVLKPVRVEVKSREDCMAVKLVNFINGVNQLLFEGLTRELPIVSFAFEQGIWMVGRIDEVRMHSTDHKAILVETKTRISDTVPSESQKRNGRIQLMCYKYLLDNLVSNPFPLREFYHYFDLEPQRALCEDLKKACCCSGFNAVTLNEVVLCYQTACKMMPRAHDDELVLRYESQRDKSVVLDEDKFAYNCGWLKGEISKCLQFWLQQREASFVAVEDQWKCAYCRFSSLCPAYPHDDDDDG
ncbi:hypothetical protein HN51_056800 [Arachis hypogaea]|uniref:Exonuclease V n=1 Tax=Arachis hypogaea TaxID=3818 RepID=A0A6B9VE80_ARAHY|nr:exonuclease V, chloroplastic-like [Arachis ipaensis]XP_025680004.1 exonuclease V, chloroplastic [Arachis hypogaea]QHN79743.1 Exonuclease V [Arachis hypogaea]